MKTSIETCQKYKLNIMSQPNKLEVSISKNEILDVLELFAQQITDFEFLYFLSGYLNDALAKRENGDFSYRWYIFALNSMTANMEIICARLLSHFKQDLSFYNLLRIICEARNYNKFIDPENKTAFNVIIKEFNESILPIYYRIFERRNKLVAHNDKMYSFDKKLNERLCEMTTEMYYKALKFLGNSVNQLYRFYAKKDILFPDGPKMTINECEVEINRFVSHLSDDGLLVFPKNQAY